MRSSTFTSVRGVHGTHTQKKNPQKKAEAKLQLHTEDENTVLYREGANPAHFSIPGTWQKPHIGRCPIYTHESNSAQPNTNKNITQACQLWLPVHLFHMVHRIKPSWSTSTWKGPGNPLERSMTQKRVSKGSRFLSQDKTMRIYHLFLVGKEECLGS